MKSIILLLFALPLLGAPVKHNAPVNRNYGRVTESNTVEYAPISLRLGNIVNGRVFPHPVTVLNPSAAQYAVQGWLPVATNAPTRPGYVAEASGAWAVTNGVVAPVWSWRALPPKVRQFSKLKVVLALQERGIWADARAWIDEQGLTDLYLAAQVFTDDNPFFAQGVAALKERFQIGDAELEAILDAVEIKQ